MSTTTLQHPTHYHPLELQDFRPFTRPCGLCHRNISAEAYACQEGCNSYYHRACAEAPPRIDRHPLHPDDPLPLIHHRPSFTCDACGDRFRSGGSSFWCEECDFHLDISCALSTLTDRGGSTGGKSPEHITLPLHSHPLVSFSTRHDFVEDIDCWICQASVDGDGYMCLRRRCVFLIHKRCIQDVYYADGTKATRVYHGHQLETFVAEDTSSSICAYCGSDDTSGEFIGCARCKLFIHRECIKVPEILQYPPHPEHSLVLFLNMPDNHKLLCRSCFSYVEVELCYHCTACKFFLHPRCALHTLAYLEEGMSLKIEWTWHTHPLLLCHRSESGSGRCLHCGDKSTGPMYACERMHCELLIHPQCMEIEPTMIHPLHSEHRLTLRRETGGPPPSCKACCGVIFHLSFSCEDCAFSLHVECSTRVPTLKNCLHEHELICLDKAPSLECNRCGTLTFPPFFRCVPCNFNLHEKCLELPLVTKSEIHWHPLTLQESYIEDDSGEYYCDHCEKRRDERLGVYVCGQCTARWAFHIECTLPELQKVFVRETQTSVIERLAKRITRKNEEIRAAEGKLEEMKQELDELVKKHMELISEEENNYAAVTAESKPEKSV